MPSLLDDPYADPGSGPGLLGPAITPLQIAQPDPDTDQGAALAETYRRVTAEMERQQQISADRGLWRGGSLLEGGLPTGAGVVDAANQYAQGLLAGTITPGVSGGAPLELKLNPNAPGFADRVSTRTPSPVQVPDVHSSADYQVGADSFNASEGGKKVPYQQRTAELIAQQPGFERFAGGNYLDPSEVHEAFVDHLADNLRALHGEVAKTDWGPDSANWYDGANALATNAGEQYGTTTRQASAMLARLSPGTPWDMNVAQFNRTAAILANHSDSPMTDAMADLYNSKYAPPTLGDGVTKNKEYKPAWADGYRTISTPDAATGQLPRLSDLHGEDAGLFVRLHDEAHNPDYTTYNLVKPDGTYGGAMPDKYTPNSNGNLGGAISIYRDGSLENISQELGDGHKIRSFHNNIVSPNAGSDVTIDTHAMAAANMMPWGVSRPEVAYGFGNSPRAPFPPHPAGADATWLTGAKGGAATGSDGLYPLYAEAYRRVADDLGILPRQLQSMTWEGIKGLYEPAARRGRMGTDLLNENSDLWRQVENGTVSRADAQAQILGRGISTPRWASGG